MYPVLCHSLELGMQGADTSSCFSVCVIRCLAPFFKKERKGLSHSQRNMELITSEGEWRKLIMEMTQDRRLSKWPVWHNVVTSVDLQEHLLALLTFQN